MAPSLPLLPRSVRWTVTVGLAAVVLYASVITVPPETPVDTLSPGFVALDKWQHFVAYGTIGYALAYAIDHWDVSRRQAALFVVGVTVLYGLGIESVQYFLSYRAFDVNDLLANSIGAALVLPWFAVRPAVDLVPVRTWLPSGS